MAAVKGVGDDGERHCQHCRPCASDEQVGDEQHVLVVDVRHHEEACASEHEAERVCQLGLLELGQHHGPAYAAYGLHGEEYANPVAGCLEAFRRRVGGVPAGFGYRSVGVVPHVKERSPAEELYESYRPECRRGFAQQLEPVYFLLVERF